MSEWSWSLTKDAAKSFKTLDSKLQKKIVTSLDLLVQQSPACQVKKLKGEEDLWRLRVGNWRLLFVKEHQHLRVIVLEIVRRTSTTY